jgi:uncharacterized membrane protein YkvA (DUF1232 family)
MPKPKSDPNEIAGADALTSADFVEFIEANAAKVTPRVLAALVSELPDLRDKFPEVSAPGFPKMHRQLWFLGEVVEAFALQREQDFPFRAAVEAAFALLYFARDIDLIPDFLSEIGYTDDAAVVATVLLRNADVFAAYAAAASLDWEEFRPAESTAAA